MLMDSSKTSQSSGKKEPCLSKAAHFTITLYSSISLALILFVGFTTIEQTNLQRCILYPPKCNPFQSPPLIVLGSIEHYTDFILWSSQDKIWFNSFRHFNVQPQYSSDVRKSSELHCMCEGCYGHSSISCEPYDDEEPCMTRLWKWLTFPLTEKLVPSWFVCSCQWAVYRGVFSYY